jgi:fructose-1,6-bisphosphatase I
MANQQTLAEWLAGQTAGMPLGEALAETIRSVADGAARLSAVIKRGPLIERPADQRSLLGVMEEQANAILMEAAKAAPVAYFASEDREEIATLDESAPLALAVEPLDGSSNIDANVSTGTIFSIYPRGADAEASLVRPGRDQVAAGYAMYGPHTMLVLTLGRGAAAFGLDTETREFLCVVPELRTPEDASMYAINAANYRHWEPPIRAYIDDCVEGKSGPRDKDFKMRWVASLVAETHRILTQGGVFLYPRDARPGHERGTLRQVFDANPIAMLAEQCGGGATTGASRILDTVPDGLHSRSPLIFGSARKVERLRRYHEDPDFIGGEAPLFGVRGLFRG